MLCVCEKARATYDQGDDCIYDDALAEFLEHGRRGADHGCYIGTGGQHEEWQLVGVGMGSVGI